MQISVIVLSPSKLSADGPASFWHPGMHGEDLSKDIPAAFAKTTLVCLSSQFLVGVTHKRSKDALPLLLAWADHLDDGQRTSRCTHIFFLCIRCRKPLVYHSAHATLVPLHKWNLPDFRRSKNPICLQTLDWASTAWKSK